ncbi:MAG TPA: DnaJ C-terminal domain-containing protein [Alphaproteobacteria bacterium]|nr:DnaJ C-terminal domain-containing protein [Alphaproteobacteria bacterium]
MRDPYTVLGVSRTASEDEIKSAYRGLAKKFHPDLNPGKKDVEQKFKEINAAYDILSDATKRAKFDRGEMDASGQERPQYSWRGAGAGRGRQQQGNSDFSDFISEDIFADLFGGGKARSTRFHGNWGAGEDPFAAARANLRGADVNLALHVSFAEAALGAKKRVTLPSGKTIDVAVPPGTENLRKLRLRGQGQVGQREGQSGDAIIEIHVEAHPFFTAKGADIHMELPVTFYEAALGASVSTPTLEGPVELKIPKGANSGTTLRLRGKGLADPQGMRGDQYVKLRVMLPDSAQEQFGKFAEKWAKDHPYDPRKKAGMV